MDAKIELHPSHRNTEYLKTMHPQISQCPSCTYFRVEGKERKEGQFSIWLTSNYQIFSQYLHIHVVASTLQPIPHLLFYCTPLTAGKTNEKHHKWRVREVNKLHPVYSFFPGDTWKYLKVRLGQIVFFSKKQHWQCSKPIYSAPLNNCLWHLNSSSQIHLAWDWFWAERVLFKIAKRQLGKKNRAKYIKKNPKP